jgi:hypothetical protein
MKVRRETPGPVQEGDREVDAGDAGSALGESESMPPMAATDVNDPRTRRKLEQLPQAGYLRANMVSRRCQTPPLCVALLEVIASPIGHVRIVEAA